MIDPTMIPTPFHNVIVLFNFTLSSLSEDAEFDDPCPLKFRFFTASELMVCQLHVCCVRNQHKHVSSSLWWWYYCPKIINNVLFQCACAKGKVIENYWLLLSSTMVIHERVWCNFPTLSFIERVIVVKCIVKHDAVENDAFD